MANRDGVEDGSGWGGLTYSTPEEKEIERLERRVKSLKDAGDKTIEAKNARIRDLEEAMLAISKGQGRFDRDNYRFACNVIEDMKAIANAALHGSTLSEGGKSEPPVNETL